MFVRIDSLAIQGVETVPIGVEVNVASRGFPTFDIVGLATKAVSESKERVRAAIVNSGFTFPAKRITVNLSPADLPKEGTFNDLSIAVGILAATGEINVSEKSLFFGELSLDGSLNATKGVFLAALHAQALGYKRLYIPNKSVSELVVQPDGVSVFPAAYLTEVLDNLKGEGTKIMQKVRPSMTNNETDETDFDVKLENIIGQYKAKRALEIAAAGRHNILLHGPPGAGKTMLAKAFRSILPPLTKEEFFESARVYSAVGKLAENKELLSRSPPFRDPHHSCSFAGFVGGLQVGEISLAHNGVLFMDEFPEFSRQIIESLRQPLEEGSMRISRKNFSATLPARFLLVAAMNPCPCGYYGSDVKECVCFPYQIRNYRNKISGPILDRIDLFVDVPAVKNSELVGQKAAESEKSEDVRKRVVTAKERLMSSNITLNDQGKRFLRSANAKLNLSARSYFKVLEVSRTIAVLAGSDEILSKHIAEALQYRGDLG